MSFTAKNMLYSDLLDLKYNSYNKIVLLEKFFGTTEPESFVIHSKHGLDFVYNKITMVLRISNISSTEIHDMNITDIEEYFKYITSNFESNIVILDSNYQREELEFYASDIYKNQWIK
jgi:hypothetical protein